MSRDTSLQAQVDAQLIEQGAFSPLEMLIDSGRLLYEDYERWRRREIGLLDEVLMGSGEKIRAELEEAVSYARGIGLVERQQEFPAWASGGTTPLRISADPQLQKLIAARYEPAQSAPQMDLFFDNPVVALTNGIARALSARDATEAQRQLDRLYAHAPNHADLAAFDKLLEALRHLQSAVDDVQQELNFLQDISPNARRLLGAQSRDLLAPLWRRLSDALKGEVFNAEHPELHGSFALSQAQDWAGVRECVLGESEWWRHEPLCLRLAQSAFHRRRRAEALTAWFHLCWLHPNRAEDALDHRRQPDGELTRLWSQFLDSEEECAPTATAAAAAAAATVASMSGATAALTAADFPAWLLLHEPALATQLAADLPTGTSPGEERYRCVHQWIHARNAGRQDDEIALRRQLQASSPILFNYLKRSANRR